VDVICARHLRRPAPFLTDQAPAHGKRQMHNLARQQAVFLRVDFAFQNSSRGSSATEVKLPVHVRLGNVRL